MIFHFIAAIVRKLLGIEIEKRTDLVSFVALLLSILTAAGSTFYLSYGFLKGAKVDIYPDDQVLIRKVDCGRGDGDMCLRLGATVAFSNSGQIGYDEVIKQIIIALKFSDESEYEQEWYKFVTFSNEDGQLKKGPVEPAVPLQIRAQNALSRDIYFTPFREQDCKPKNQECKWHNYLGWNAFLNKLVVGENITVTITAESLDNKILGKKSCKVDIDQDLIDRLKKAGWQSPSCWLLDQKEL